MKKIIHTLLLIPALVLNACAFFPRAAPAPVPPTATFTPAPTLSPTPTLTLGPPTPLPTFTFTPTLIGYKTPTFTPENTSTPSITPTLTDIYSKVTPFTPTPSVRLDGFESVVSTSDTFYAGNGCDPISVKFTVKTIHKTKASYVVLFIRLVSKTSGAKSEWTSITMENDGEDVFTHVLVPSEIKAVSGFENPWVQYQFVATTAQSKEVGRTGVFDQYLTLLRCVPTPTPTFTPKPK